MTAVELTDDDRNADTPYVAIPPPEVEAMFLTGPAADFIDHLNAKNVERVEAERKARSIIARGSIPKAANDNNAVSHGLPETLCYPPGAVGDFTRFMVSSSRFPSPPLALAGALSVVAALAGRRYRGPTRLGTNIYLVGLADSGHGKDITLRGPIAIVDSTSAKSVLSGKFFIEDLASVQGLAMKLRKDPSACLQKDEFGKWLGSIAGKRAPAHEAAIATAMLQLTGASTGTWGGTEKAAGQLARVINPCFSIHGVTTPSTFWAALSDGSIAEGLLGRLVLFDAGTRMPTKVRLPATSLDNIPTALTEHVKRLVGDGLGGNLMGVIATGDAPPREIITVPYAEGVHDLFEDFDDRLRAEATRTNPAFRPMLMRVAENAGRLALIVAIGCDPAKPVITMDVQEWANAVAEHSYRTMAAGAADNIAETAHQADYLRVRQMISRKGSDGITHGDILRQLRGRIPRKICDDIFAQLLSADEAVFGETTASSGQRHKRWWAKADKPAVFRPEFRPPS